jgi:hypothetical protein
VPVAGQPVGGARAGRPAPDDEDLSHGREVSLRPESPRRGRRRSG